MLGQIDVRAIPETPQFRQFYREFAPRLQRFAWSRTGNSAASEDLTQKAFTKLVEDLRAGKPVADQEKLERGDFYSLQSYLRQFVKWRASTLQQSIVPIPKSEEQKVRKEAKKAYLAAYEKDHPGESIPAWVYEEAELEAKKALTLAFLRADAPTVDVETPGVEDQFLLPTFVPAGKTKQGQTRQLTARRKELAEDAVDHMPEGREKDLMKGILLGYSKKDLYDAMGLSERLGDAVYERGQKSIESYVSRNLRGLGALGKAGWVGPLLILAAAGGLLWFFNRKKES